MYRYVDVLDILNRHEDFDSRAFLDDRCEVSWDLYTDLYELWVEEMPYGTAKGRDGDPYEWVCNRLFQELGDLV